MIFLLACIGTGTHSESKDSQLPNSCDQVVAEISSELATIQACSGAWECGQELLGSSCGCTRNLVARTDADIGRWQSLMEQGSELGCDLGTSTCDCPAAAGYACVSNRCTWNYMPSDWGQCSDPGDGFTTNFITVQGDRLLVAVTYGGGCAEHQFTTCWPDLSFAESNPVQAMLELSHNANSDPCDGIVEETVEVDLTTIRSAWQSMYHSEHGEVILNMGGFSASYSF